MSTLDVSVVMPCLNEVETLPSCVRKAQTAFADLGLEGEVVVADNGSTDGSRECAEQLGARVVDVPVRGYGAALAAGIAASRGRHVVMGDADDSYDFSRLAPFVDRLRRGDQIVNGNRFAGGIERGAMPLLHRYVGNRVLTMIARRFFHVPVRDVYCGLRGFERDAILALDLRSTGMEYAIEMLVKSSLHGLRVSEVPTPLARDGRTRPPHLRTWSDGWRSLRFLLLYSPTWLFFYPGLLLAAIGLAGLLVVVAASAQTDLMMPMVVAVLIGAQSALFAAFAKVFAIAEGLLPPESRTMRVLRHVSLEVGLAVASIVVVAGIALLAVGADSRGGASGTRLLLLGSTLFAIGIQGVLSSFFLSILGLRRAGGPPALDRRPLR